MLAITPTKLSDYLLCPHKYKLKNVEKFANSGSSSPALSFGIAIHDALQELHKPVNPSQKIQDMSELLIKHWVPNAYANAEEDDQYFIKGCQALERYQQAYINGSGEPTTVGTEVYMTYIFKLGDLQVRLGCKADRVCVHADQLLEVIDYKTSNSGKVPTSEFLLKDLPTFIYYILSRTAYPDYKFFQITFLNVLTLARTSVEYTPAQITANKKALSECLTQIAANNFAASPSEACSWCSYQDTCAAANQVVDFSVIN